MNLIIDNIYIGNLESANIKNLKTHNIKLVLNCSRQQYQLPNEIEYRYIDINDPPSNKCNRYIYDNYVSLVELIKNSVIQGHGILVHCRSGMQRSATIVCIYLMMKYKYGLDEAIDFIKSKRQICFFGQVNYEEVLNKIYYDLNKMNIVTSLS